MMACPPLSRPLLPSFCIGTTSPTETLQVQGKTWLNNNSGDVATRALGTTISTAPGANYVVGTDPQDSLRTLSVITKGSTRPTILSLRNVDSPTGFWDFVADPNASKLYISQPNANPALTIQTNDFVGIGTTSPGTRLQVAGVISTTGGLGAYPAGQAMCYDNSAGYDKFGFCSSDIRLKKDIKPVEDGLQSILAIHPSQFVWRESGAQMAGFIAQDVQKAMPYGVLQQPNAEYLALDTTAILSYVVKAIQEFHTIWLENSGELHTEIDRLKSENTALKASLCKKDSSYDFCSQ